MSAHKGSILIIDDDPLVIFALTHGLSKKGFIADGINDANKIEGAVANHVYDLIMLDYHLNNGMCCMDYIAIIKKYTDAPFIVFSSENDLKIAHRAAQSGAVSYLVKPLIPATIGPTLEAAIEQGKKINGIIRSMKENTLYDLARGIIMHRHTISSEQAKHTIKRFARSRQETITEICRKIVEAEEIHADFNTARVAKSKVRGEDIGPK